MYADKDHSLPCRPNAFDIPCLVRNMPISSSLTINVIERKRSWNKPVAYPICRSVCLSVCLSGNYTVAKRLIGSGCRLGGEWGQSRDGCIGWGW